MLDVFIMRINIVQIMVYDQRKIMFRVGFKIYIQDKNYEVLEDEKNGIFEN